MPEEATEISEEESLRYKREVLARQFYRIRETVRQASPSTQISFNVPYWKAAEDLWVDHPMLNESDVLLAESIYGRKASAASTIALKLVRQTL
jgi:hypothetical protein